MGFAPSQPNAIKDNTQKKKKISKKTPSLQKNEFLDWTLVNKGKKNKIKIAPNIKTTPPNLLGIHRKIA